MSETAADLKPVRVPYNARDTFARGLSHDDMHYDGYAGVTVEPPRTSGAHDEFPHADVYYVNGIATTLGTSVDNAAEYSKAVGHDVTVIHDGTNIPHTGDRAPDALKAMLEHEVPAFAYTQAPEQSIAEAILKHVRREPNGALDMEKDVHFAAHSRGAIVTQRGIELAEITLALQGASAADLANVRKGISVETFGGAACEMPSGVRTVNYVDPNDGVAAVLGVGSVNPHVLRDFERTIGTDNSPALGILAGTIAATKLESFRDRIAGNEDVRTAGYIEVKPIDVPSPTDDLFTQNHDQLHYIHNRQPFEAALAHQQYPDRGWLHAQERGAQAHELLSDFTKAVRADLATGVVSAGRDALSAAIAIGRDARAGIAEMRDPAAAIKAAASWAATGVPIDVRAIEANPAMTLDAVATVGHLARDAGTLANHLAQDTLALARGTARLGRDEIRELAGDAVAAPGALARKGLDYLKQTPMPFDSVVDRAAEGFVASTAGGAATLAQHTLDAGAGALDAGLRASIGRTTTLPLHVTRTDAQNRDSEQIFSGPFKQSGVILDAGPDHVTQRVRGGETFTYQTKELLGNGFSAVKLEDLVRAKDSERPVTLQMGPQGLLPGPLEQSLAPAHERVAAVAHGGRH